MQFMGTTCPACFGCVLLPDLHTRFSFKDHLVIVSSSSQRLRTTFKLYRVTERCITYNCIIVNNNRNNNNMGALLRYLYANRNTTNGEWVKLVHDMVLILVFLII